MSSDESSIAYVIIDSHTSETANVTNINLICCHPTETDTSR